MKKHQKQPGDYFDGSVFLWQLHLCQYSDNGRIIIVALSFCKR